LLARLDSPWLTGLFGCVVAILTWDYIQIVPTYGLDASWMLGLNLAAQAGLDHGTQIAFTFGPLGFLEQPMVIDGLLSTLAAIYLFGLRALLAASLLWAARRSFPWPAAAAIAFVVAAIIPRTVGSVPLALTLLWTLLALQRDAPPWTARALAYGGGALAAVEALVKLNTGLTVVIAVLIAVVGLPGDRLRNLGRFAATAIATFVVLWFAAGQGVGNLDDYLRSSFQLVSGYDNAMQLEQGAVPWDWFACLVVAIASIGLVAGSPGGRRARLAKVALVAVFAFSLEKYAYVRHEPGHAGVLLGVLAVVWLTPRWSGEGRLVAAAAVALIALAYVPVADESLDTSVAPKVAVNQLADLVVPSERDEAADQARLALAAGYALDPQMLARIGSSPVDVRPWEIGIVWAYGLDWRPLPVIQDYAAYTPQLDELNADALASPDGPRFVLRHLGYESSSLYGLEGRLAPFDAPLEQRELLCGFRATATTPTYQLLERDGDRCGAERNLGTVEAAYGEPVPIPRGHPDEAVFARIDGAGAEGVERLRAFAYREALRSVTLGGITTRFETATAPDGLLLRAPAGADFPRPFALALNATTITIDSEGGFATSEGPLELHFFAVPIASQP
jgi:hypothetical protein